MAEQTLNIKSVADALQQKAVTLLTEDTSGLNIEQRQARREDIVDKTMELGLLESLSSAADKVVTTIEHIKQIPSLSSLQLIKALRGF